MIFLCVFGVSAFFLGTTLIVRGAQNSLDRGLERLGADVLVVPQGAEAKVETALLMGKPTEVWMSDSYLTKVAAVPGVASVSPQVYLRSLYGASCCAVSEMFLVVYDPATDTPRGC
jgi:putative ABC transport system permease protein